MTTPNRNPQTHAWSWSQGGDANPEQLTPRARPEPSPVPPTAPFPMAWLRNYEAARVAGDYCASEEARRFGVPDMSEEIKVIKSDEDFTDWLPEVGALVQMEGCEQVYIVTDVNVSSNVLDETEVEVVTEKLA